MIEQPLLTVIVTCYNVEKYLNKCISSIVGQTYNNFEILLIDDGSPDRCGEICDAWQEKDQRIRAIHKQNEGLAYARKTGVEHATGEYVTFVDADDWIDADMYANMIAALIATGSDIAQCGVCEVYEDGSMTHRDSEQKTGKYEIVGRIEGVLLIVGNEKWYSWMWNKIFKKHLFDGINFYKGNSYAEDFISHYLFHKANQSIYFSDEYCYYFQRSDSISGSTGLSNHLKRHYDFFEALYDRLCFVEQYSEYHSALLTIKPWVIDLGIKLLRNSIIFPQYFNVGCFKEKSKQLRSISLKQREKIKINSIKIEFYILKLAGSNGYQFFRMMYNAMIKITNCLKITNRQTFTLYRFD